MRIILKPAGLFLITGAMVILVTLLVLRNQSQKLTAIPQSAPIAAFKSKRNAPIPLYDDPSKMTPVNLTESGKVDWVHWAGNSVKTVARKKNGKAISDLALIAPQAGTVKEGERGPSRGIFWADGAGKNESTKVTYDAVHAGVQNGFRFAVSPKDNNLHHLRVYVGGWKTGGAFDARMSDGSPVKIEKEDAALSNGYYSRIYTVEFQPTAADRSLNIEWKATGSTGNISLQAAALE
jgi:hypothetical protein